MALRLELLEASAEMRASESSRLVKVGDWSGTWEVFDVESSRSRCVTPLGKAPANTKSDGQSMHMGHHPETSHRYPRLAGAVDS